MTIRLAVSVMGVLVAIAATLAACFAVGVRLGRSDETDSGEALPAGVPGLFVVVNGHRVHVVERGDGPPLLLVHGTGGTTFDWETSVLDAFARSHRVVAVDLFGMGFSARDDAFHYGFELWADQLAGTLGIERASLVGQSLGGAIVTVFAGRHPDRALRVVSVDSGPWMPPFMLVLLTPGIGELYLARRVYWPERPDQPEPYAARMRAVYRIAGTRRNLLRLNRGQFLDARAYLRWVRRAACPVLLVHGRDDDIIPLRAAQSLQRSIAGSRLAVIDGAGHFAMQDQPERFVEVVEPFLRDDAKTAASSR
ncbi:MAG TPA: alpha/beta hydrolase [Myxococcota bacterium]|nr:alpha/beta hydrolase [Myxococcota bacterium]